MAAAVLIFAFVAALIMAVAGNVARNRREVALVVPGGAMFLLIWGSAVRLVFGEEKRWHFAVLRETLLGAGIGGEVMPPVAFWATNVMAAVLLLVVVARTRDWIASTLQRPRRSARSRTMGV